MAEVSLEGYKDLLKQFEDFADMPDTREMEKRLIIIARRLRNQIRRRAPKTRIGSGNLRVRTGNLRRSIQARRFRNKIKGSPAVYVRSNRKIAPHAHLVEYGTRFFRYPIDTKVYQRGSRKGTIREKRKALHFWIDGEEIFAKYVAPMPANPFFRSTVDSSKNEIELNIEKELVKFIEEIDKR